MREYWVYVMVILALGYASVSWAMYQAGYVEGFCQARGYDGFSKPDWLKGQFHTTLTRPIVCQSIDYEEVR